MPRPLVQLPATGQPKTRHSVRGGRIIVRTVRRPEVDAKKLIRLLDRLREDEHEDLAA